MNAITFFEKPGCAGNARQRAWLQAAGHRLHVRDLLGEPWTPDALLPFLNGHPVAAWFNRASPRVKSGEVDPDALSADAALALLLADHLLIRRPLLVLPDGRRMLGFDAAAIDAAVGLGGAGPLPARTEGCVGDAARCVPPTST